MKDAFEFEYELIRSDRRTLAAEITPEGRLLVRAPRRMRQEQIEKFLSEKELWIITHLERARSRDVRFDRDRYTEMEIERMKSDLRELVIPLVERYKHLVGVEPASVRINRSKGRFGSCGPNGTLNFSCFLSLYPMEAIEYVVVHELCHRKELNHSARFWNEVERILPDYKTRRSWLKERGSGLIARI